MKIHISAESSGVAPQLLGSLKQLGAEIKRGAPPKSRSERIMQLLLDHAEIPPNIGFDASNDIASQDDFDTQDDLASKNDFDTPNDGASEVEHTS
eukprot:120801-Pyramimonas_sp.AAC.1